MRMRLNSGDTSSINIERVFNLDNISPVIYSDVYSDNYSINPLPGSNSSDGGHDITKYDNIRFSVIEGPTYFGDSYVSHSSTDVQSPYDLNYIFNNKLEISFNVSLNGESLILPNDLQNQINIDDDFSFAYYFNNQDWLNIDNQSFGTLIYTIDILDNADNYNQQMYITLHSTAF